MRPLLLALCFALDLPGGRNQGGMGALWIGSSLGVVFDQFELEIFDQAEGAVVAREDMRQDRDIEHLFGREGAHDAIDLALYLGDGTRSGRDFIGSRGGHLVTPLEHMQQPARDVDRDLADLPSLEPWVAIERVHGLAARRLARGAFVRARETRFS